jgi:hypothetical protein
MILQFAAKPEDHPGRKKNKDRAHEDPPLDEDPPGGSEEDRAGAQAGLVARYRPKRGMARAAKATAAE